MSEADVRDLGREIYHARLKEAWGPHWVVRDRWPKDDAAWRQYPHQPAAEVDLCLVQARAALRWWSERA